MGSEQTTAKVLIVSNTEIGDEPRKITYQMIQRNGSIILNTFQP